MRKRTKVRRTDQLTARMQSKAAKKYVEEQARASLEERANTRVEKSPAEKRSQLKNIDLVHPVEEVADGSCPLCAQAFSNQTKLQKHASTCEGRRAKVSTSQ